MGEGERRKGRRVGVGEGEGEGRKRRRGGVGEGEGRKGVGLVWVRVRGAGLVNSRIIE